MKLQSYRRLQRGDFEPQYQDLVDKLAFTINSSFESLFFALNGQLTLTDNSLTSVNTFSIIVDAKGNPTTVTKFNINITGQVYGFQVLNAINLTNSTTYPTGTPFLSFTKTNQTIAINNISGLSAGDTWTITAVGYGK